MILNLSNIFLFFFLTSMNATRLFQYKIFQWQIFYYNPYGAIVYLNVKVNHYVYLTWLKVGSDKWDLYDENGDIKSSGDILGQLIDKRIWVREFKILKTVLKHVIDKIQKEMLNMTRISIKYTCHFQTGYYSFLEENFFSFIKSCSKENSSHTYTNPHYFVSLISIS